MPNRLSPGCCCGCDIFKASFDLFYVLESIPATADDWWTPQTTGNNTFDNTERRFSIAEGQPGEGMVFYQRAGTFIVDGLPGIFSSNRQRWIPQYDFHPDPEPIRAIPHFQRFTYLLANPETPLQPNYFTLYPTSLSPGLPPLGPAALAVITEARWEFYWREHFRLMNADGEVELPFDRVPFRLHEGETIESKYSIPGKWSSINFTNFRYLAEFLLSLENSARLSFVEESGSEVFAVEYGVPVVAPSLISSALSRQSLRLFEAGVERFSNQDAASAGWSWTSGGSGSQFSAYERWNWIHIRDGHFTLSNRSLSPYEHGSGEVNFGLPHSFFSLHGITIPLTSQPERLKLRLSIGGEPLRLSTVSGEKSKAPRIDTWPIRQIPNPEGPEGPEIDDPTDRPGAANVNDRCTPRLTCPVVYPYGHVKWKLLECSIAGMGDATVIEELSAHCSHVYVGDSEPVPATQSFGESGTLSDFVALGLPPSHPVFVPVRSGGYSASWPASQAARGAQQGGAHKALVIVEDFDEQNYRVRIEFETTYFAPIFTGLFGPANLNRAIRAEPLTIPAPNDQGLVSVSFAGNFYPHATRTGIIKLEKIVPKFEGDSMPVIEFLGSDAQWPNNGAERYLQVLTGESVEFVRNPTLQDFSQPTWPLGSTNLPGLWWSGTGMFQRSETTDTIDLATLRIRIGGPDAV